MDEFRWRQNVCHRTLMNFWVTVNFNDASSSKSQSVKYKINKLVISIDNNGILMDRTINEFRIFFYFVSFSFFLFPCFFSDELEFSECKNCNESIDSVYNNCEESHWMDDQNHGDYYFYYYLFTFRLLNCCSTFKMVKTVKEHYKKWKTKTKKLALVFTFFICFKSYKCRKFSTI